MQRSLLASHLAHPEHPAQSMALLSHIDGPIDPARLAASFAAVVATNDVLRTRIGAPGTGSIDAVDLADPNDLPETDIVELGRHEVDAWARSRTARPLDVSVCGWDSAIAAHPDGTVSWYLNLNHVITDATSSALVFAATAAVYHRTDPIPRPMDGSSYYDWSRRLVDALAEATGPAARAIDHWRTREPAPGLGRLYRAPDRPSPVANRLELDLGQLLDRSTQRIEGDFRMLTEQLGWSALLVTAAALWTHRVTGSDRFAIGLPVHNRSDPECRELIGPTMEVFPVDIEVEHDDTGRSLHRRISRSIMRTLGHAVPGTAPAGDYELVVNVIPRAEQSAFGPHPASTRWLHAGAIDGSHLARIQMTAYTAEASETGSSIDGPAWEFAIDLNEGAADPEHRLVAPDHFLTALRFLVDEPDLGIGGWSLPTDDEQATIERWGHGEDFDGPTEPVVPDLRSALGSATGIAVVDDDLELSGPEALAWIDAVAAWLIAAGVEPGDRVAIDLPRSAEAVVAIAATLVAGGSFVPLDPSQPEARRARLVERARCRLVIDRTDAVARLRPDGEPAPVTAPGAVNGANPSGDRTGDDRTIDPTVAVDDEAEAYVIFTSGSTGEPKGVPITRRGLARYLRFATERYTGGDRPQVVAPLFSPLTFDLTITSIFLPLLTGGRLVVIADDGPHGLAEVARRTDLTWLKATPSHLEILTRLLPADHALATLVVGGEAFGTRLARDLLADRPDLEIHNEYGPTEAVVGCMDYRVEVELLSGQSEVPIGAPAPGVELAVIDSHGQRAPIGGPGELWIAHEGLTAGYLDAPGVPGDGGHDGAAGPFVEWEGRRWYRSGDLVRLQDPERLVYLGRADEQVKVGGIRLEPMEVEEALDAHPAIERSAVRLWSPATDAPSAHCVRCGLPDNIPGVGFDDAGVCDTCHDFDRVAPTAEGWFRTPADLAAVRDRARERRTGDHDCLHLLSGGKDSTYALYQLVELGFRPYALTLDNGFISDEAKANVARSVTDLGIDHEFVTLDAMNAIFRDSLDRHSNVCHGCYKAIYTVATNRADELGIPLIVTGLSRGQLFETRLIPQQFSADRFDPEAIDRAVVEARKVYHRLDDGPNRLLDTEIFADDETFERIEYLDFYRYVDVELAEMLRFLDQRAPWVRPSDTGRSTNCLINAAGIHTHQTEQGYHNYAVPYAWDVRLGHKTRTEAIEELDDRLDLADVQAMLDEVGYQPRHRRILTAWIVPKGGDGNGTAPGIPSPAELRSFLARTLPSHAVPSAFVEVETLPLSTNGKLDAAALPRPERVNRPGPTLALSPTNPTEEAVIALWERVLATEPIGIDDDFFALGGDSLAALEMIVALGDQLGRPLGEDLAFTNPTPRSLAAAIDAANAGDTANPSDTSDTSDTSNAADTNGAVEQTTGAATGGAPGAGPGLESYRTAPGDAPARSDGELAILYDQSLRPDDVMYNVARSYRVAGPVDAAAFAGALLAEAGLHQPLTWTHGTPRRRLEPAEAISVEVAADVVESDRFEAAADELNRQPFDLDRGPLLRALVQPLTDGTTGIVLAVHHASGDAASFDRLWNRLDARLTGREPDELPIDYAGFGAWQAAARTDGEAGYWLDQGRRGPAARLAILPPTAPEPDGFLTRRASVDAEALRTGTRSRPAAAALAALAAVVAVHADAGPPAESSADGSSADIDPDIDPDSGPADVDVEIGLITSTRNDPAAAELFGYFLNTLPVRLAVGGEGDDDLTTLTRTAAEAIGGVLANRTTPRARIAADRRAAGLPVPELQVLMAWDELDDLRLRGAVVEQRVRWNGTAVAPLTFFAESRGDRLDLSVEWQGSTVPAAVATNMLELWDRLLTAAASRPDAPTGRTIDAALTELGAAADLDGGPAVDGEPVLHRIEHHLRTGTGPAVIAGGTELDWPALASRSDVVAASLRRRGIGPGHRVAVLVPRSVETVVAIVGVVRAGAAYVPIDPGYPPDRIALALATSAAAVALVGAGTEPVAGDAVESVVIDPTGVDGRPWPQDDPDDLAAGRSDDNGADDRADNGADDRADTADRPPVGPDDEAYLIFTSGSTGTPRGVPITHGNLSASTNARDEVYPRAPERFLVPSSPAFDSSIVGLFWTLSAGGAVVLPTEREVHDLDALLGLLETVDHTLLVPTLYRALLDRNDATGATRRWPDRVIVAGESCPPALVEAHNERFPGAALTNEYGPTEATVWATAHHCRPGDDPVPIGPPIPGARVAVLDRAGRIRPTGVEGELVVGGAGVADGYLDRPDATARSFGRFPDGAGGPLFRTGDRAVVSGSVIRFLGRDDHRLNVGGVRAEPEEIERVLTSVDGVTAAVVIAVDVRSRDELLRELDPHEVGRAMRRAADQPDPATALDAELRHEGTAEVRLVAHVEGPPDLGVDRLRSAVRDGLPATLRPSHVAVHHRLPRTPNGKLDRVAAAGLPITTGVEPGTGTTPAADASTAGADAVDPELLALLRDHFADSLRHADLGHDDSFFDRGGHSLLAMELVMALEDAIGRPVPVADLYDHPTPRELARHLATGAAPTPASVVADRPAGAIDRSFLVPIQPNGNRSPIFAIHVLGVDCAFFRPLSARLGPDQPMYGLGQPTVELDTAGPTDVADVARGYAEEIDRVAPDGPVVLAAISLGGVVAYELAQQLLDRGREVSLLALFDAFGPDATPPSTRQRLAAQLTRATSDPARFAREQAGHQGRRVMRTIERGGLSVRRRLGIRNDARMQIRRFIEDNVRAQSDYRYEPYAGSMLVIKAGDDPLAADHLDDGMGWRVMAAGGLELASAPGGHLSMMDEPNVEWVAEAMQASLDEAAEATGPRSPEADPDRPHRPDDIESALIDALGHGRLSAEVRRRRSQATPGSAAAELLDDVDLAMTALAGAAERAGGLAATTIGGVGIDARTLPVPGRLTYPLAVIEVDSSPVRSGPDVGRALADAGFRPIATTDGGFRAAEPGTVAVDHLAPDGTARVRLRWSADNSAVGRRTGGSTGVGDRSGDDLGILLGTPPGLIRSLLAAAGVTPGQTVVDLGCGDGRVLIEAATVYGCRGRGYELDPVIAEAARRRVSAAGVEHLVEIVTGDARTAEVGDADLVFAFLPPEAVGELLDPVLARLRPGARFLSHEQLPSATATPPDRRHLVVATGDDEAVGGITVANLWTGPAAPADA
ncbi:MAG: amino acid adenylation domain-containing protein [Actinomycetota bacterium]